jgi:hypothetical protein
MSARPNWLFGTCLGKLSARADGVLAPRFEEIVDDHKDELTIELISEDHTETLVLDEAQRKLAATEGWSFFVNFVPSFYRDQNADKK